MLLSTLLLGLNHRLWNNELTLGRSSDLGPFLDQLGYVERSGFWVHETQAFGLGQQVIQLCTSHGNIHWEQSNLPKPSWYLENSPLATLFYIAAKTPGIGAFYNPTIIDKETLIKMAGRVVFAEDPYFNAMLNTYNKVVGARYKVYLKDLKQTRQRWYYEGNATEGNRVLLSKEVHYSSINQDTHVTVDHLRTIINNWGSYVACTLFAAVTDEAPCEILQYSTKVERYLQVVIPPKAVRYGIELELEGHTPTRIKQAHAILKKHCIFKRDGSITNGMEIVSKPDTVENHKKIFKEFFDANLGYEAKSNCGIHIHASRGNMSFLQIGRIHSFLNKNEKEIVKIAGRSSSYARFDERASVLTPWEKSTDKYAPKKRFTWDKYTSVNLAPSETMEFRIFKSTTDYKEFCRFVEFPDALISYAALEGDDNKGKIKTLNDLMKFSNFADFVASRGSVYPELNKFIQKECI